MTQNHQIKSIKIRKPWNPEATMVCGLSNLLVMMIVSAWLLTREFAGTEREAKDKRDSYSFSTPIHTGRRGSSGLTRNKGCYLLANHLQT